MKNNSVESKFTSADSCYSNREQQHAEPDPEHLKYMEIDICRSLGGSFVIPGLY